MIKTIAAVAVLGGAMFGFSGCAAGDAEEIGATEAYLSAADCNVNSGINPMKAALAVAMATEMGRVDPLADLKLGYLGVTISDSGWNRCWYAGYNGCPNTWAILNMQDPAVNNQVNQAVFNSTAFREDLKASFDRQRNHENHLRQNEPSRMPEDHSLRETGMTNYGACGIHYDFKATGNKISNIKERLVFFGGNSNPFLAFRSTDTTISIDPTGTMNGDTTTVTNVCTLGCTAYGSQLRDKCCSCDGRQGLYKTASWDRTMLYCAY